MALGESKFSSGDFIYEYPENGDCYLKIIFQYNDEYCFELIERNEVDSYTESNPLSYALGGAITRKDKVINRYIYCSPGEHKVTDKISISDFGSAIEHINDWCISIYSEISSDPRSSHIDNFREEIEKSFPCGEIENEYEISSNEEQIDFSKKMDDLYSKFETMSQQVNVASDELASIKKELEALKDSSKTIPKGIFQKMTKNKIVDIAVKFFKTPEGKKLAISGIKKIFQLE